MKRRNEFRVRVLYGWDTDVLGLEVSAENLLGERLLVRDAERDAIRVPPDVLVILRIVHESDGRRDTKRCQGRLTRRRSIRHLRAKLLHKVGAVLARGRPLHLPSRLEVAVSIVLIDVHPKGTVLRVLIPIEIGIGIVIATSG